MDINLKKLLAAEIDDMLQNELNDTIYELNQKIKEMIPKIHIPNLEPEILKEIQNFSKTNIEIMNTISSTYIKAFQTNFFIPVTNLFLDVALKPIDIDKLTKGLKIQLDCYEKAMTRYDDQLWAIDEAIFNKIESVNLLPSFQQIEHHVEDNLNQYMEYFSKDAFYIKYASLLEQSYSAYKDEQYILASFPLFAVIEGLITTSFHDYEINLELKPFLKGNKNKLYTKLTDYVKTTEDEIAINVLFFRRVSYVFNNLFKPSWNKHPTQINRNWIMHGSYNYDQIKKSDILKLFQLIKAAEVLKNITFENIASQSR
ncbi:hypothetical protein CEF21_16605 [Bacillus sp. FJAT-42376]|uniref:hypothetical protein n=1 Tax=Bacillus sp. FJAT-42376 TaxID=2014076 RepID=UPI000F4E531A|nr:hypothetical protein [Bacillus sp. FJAT-42376]AZB43796.1 hypothetical protein CEF21_16605 [Bacillus sp. FJAT-42376]